MRRTIRYKIFTLIFVSILALVIAGPLLGYYMAWNLFRDMIIADRVSQADMLRDAVSRITMEEIEAIELIFSIGSIRQAIAARNASYEGMSPEEIKEKLLVLDREWISAGGDSAVKKSLLDSDVSKDLKRVMNFEKSVIEVFVTDKYGGVVGLSNITSDYYQADEKWWTDAFHKKKTFIGDVTFDESSQGYGVSLGVPIFDEQGEVLGVCKAVVDAYSFFAPLSSYLRKDSNAVLVNDQNKIIYKDGVQPLQERFIAQEIFDRISRMERSWFFDRSSGRAQERFFVFAHVNAPILVDNGISWMIFIEQTKKDLFATLYVLLRQAGVLTIALFIMVLLTSIYFSGVIIQPIKKLIDEINFIARQNFRHRVNIRSQDELEDLGNSINHMLDKLDELTISREILAQEIRKKTKAQEELILANQSLAENETALKNILYDLKKAHEDLKSTQKQLLQSDKMAAVGQLSAGVAHEIKNPLAIIQLSVESIASKVDRADEKMQRNVKMIKDAAERANRVVTELLNFSRQSDLSTEPVNIFDVVENTINLCENTTRIRKIAVQRKWTDKRNYMVSADRVLLQQVFFNLLANAMDAVGEGGEITLDIKADHAGVLKKKHVVIEVRDTGCGIPEEMLPKIFDPFFTTKEPGKGTGLGLSTVYMILEKHQGDIKVESRVGEGTVFYVSLPLMNDQEAHERYSEKKDTDNR